MMSTLENTEDILFKTLNNAGIITLNRPKSLNALNTPIVMHMLPKLWEWEKTKRLVIIKGNGKAFCAGGDIKHVLDVSRRGVKHDEIDMVLFEYNINNLIGNYKIPYVALMDGIAMGGGLGVSVHGSYRIASENTVISMPETKIGLIPDVGASYFLSRLPSHLGFYLGLTSDVMTGKDVAAVGIATHYVSSNRLNELESELTHCVTDEDVKRILNRFQEPVEESYSLSPYLNVIDNCFSAKTVEEIISRLNTINNDWSRDVVKTLRERCPLTLKLSLESLRRGVHLDLWHCLQMEKRLCSRLSLEHNFKEGVRALLIDRDNKPQWIPRTVEEVTDDDTKPYFEPLPIGELTYLSPNAKL